VLLPPNARPVRSSRLIRMRGPPRAAENRGVSSSGVGNLARLILGTHATRSLSMAVVIGTGDRDSNMGLSLVRARHLVPAVPASQNTSHNWSGYAATTESYTGVASGYTG